MILRTVQSIGSGQGPRQYNAAADLDLDNKKICDDDVL